MKKKNEMMILARTMLAQVALTKRWFESRGTKDRELCQKLEAVWVATQALAYYAAERAELSEAERNDEFPLLHG